MALFIGESLSLKIALIKLGFGLGASTVFLGLHWWTGTEFSPLTWGLAAVAFLWFLR